MEALLKIGRGGLAAQFKSRTSDLAREMEVKGVDEDFCGRMYDGRSAWVHGAHVQLFDPAEKENGTDPEQREVIADIEKLQDTLRRALRRAVEDPEFRAIFDSDEAIANRWPA